MTQEEKAKAYDEAIEKLRNLHDNYDTVSTLIDIKEELEHIFPELRESEDEKIRGTLLSVFKEAAERIGDNREWDSGITYMSVVAWLEKQGQKPAWTEEDSMIQNGIILDGVVYELTTGFPDNACSLCGNCELHEKCMELSDGSPCYFFADSFRKVFRKVKMERKL